MDAQLRLGRWLFRHRLGVMLGFFVLAVASAIGAERLSAEGRVLLRPLGFLVPRIGQDLVRGLSGGGCLVAFLVRMFAEARLENDVYGQGGSRRFVEDGPFAWVRNPLYLGTFLFFASAEILWAPLVLWGPISVGFAWVLDRMVRFEETLLLAQFGEPYRCYLARVPRWVPRRPKDAAPVLSPSWAAYRFAILGNLGLVSLGLYRIALAFGSPLLFVSRVQLVLLLLWIGVLAMRRLRAAARNIDLGAGART